MTKDYDKGTEVLFDEALELCDRLQANYKEKGYFDSKV